MVVDVVEVMGVGLELDTDGIKRKVDADSFARCRSFFIRFLKDLSSALSRCGMMAKYHNNISKNIKVQIGGNKRICEIKFIPNCGPRFNRSLCPLSGVLRAFTRVSTTFAFAAAAFSFFCSSNSSCRPEASSSLVLSFS